MISVVIFTGYCSAIFPPPTLLEVASAVHRVSREVSENLLYLQAILGARR